ncbi:hypothetical protein ANN_03777 [Periplaneta americana]|uniref:DUF4817 domain-containing protein n=1 Tax=Periplaneta americana TaxID=6978 RepID=A0ABQ8TZX4_PERAM|nr:hypothetical protein ANN_03777 [Periplaneta americana]
MQYTLNQRLFLVKQYWITNSITATQRAYQREFGVRNPPKRNTILGLINKLETTGSLVSEKGKHRLSRLPTVVVDSGERGYLEGLAFEVRRPVQHALRRCSGAPGGPAPAGVGGSVPRIRVLVGTTPDTPPRTRTPPAPRAPSASIPQGHHGITTSHSQPIYVPGKYSPSSCLSDKEEDEIYGFGYGIYGKQMLQRQQQQKMIISPQVNYQRPRHTFPYRNGTNLLILNAKQSTISSHCRKGQVSDLPSFCTDRRRDATECRGSNKLCTHQVIRKMTDKLEVVSDPGEENCVISGKRKRNEINYRRNVNKKNKLKALERQFHWEVCSSLYDRRTMWYVPDQYNTLIHQANTNNRFSVESVTTDDILNFKYWWPEYYKKTTCSLDTLRKKGKDKNMFSSAQFSEFVYSKDD